MFGFFAKRVAVNTGVVIASTGIAHVSYTAGASAYNYFSNKFDNSLWYQQVSSEEKEECIHVACTPMSY